MTERRVRRDSGTFRSTAAWCVGAALVALTSSAQAQAQIEVQPLFGERCVPRSGPTEFVVGLANPTTNATSGTIVVEQVGANYLPGVRTVYSAPFAVGPRATVTVRVPVPPAGVAANDLTLTVRDANNRPVSQRPLRYENPADNLFIDATPQARLAYALNSANTMDPTAMAQPSPLAGLSTGLTPCAALRMPQTGDVVLPRHAAGYNGVSLLLVDAGTVISLPAAERTALADYVLSGGTLVVIPQRADELRHPTLQAMLGANITSLAPAPLDPTNGQWLAAVPGSPVGSFPLAATLEHLETYQGGNLTTRDLAPLFPWGAANLMGGTADYGFGRVHVLSFNPAMPPAIEDPWAVGIVTRLAQQSGATRAARVIDDTPDLAGVPNAVRRALDPNEGFRPGLGFAVVLLLLYAIIAGPVMFRLATRANKPFRGLALLPLFSAVAFGGIVALGGVSRGFQGRSRRVAVFEIPAGMTRGAMRRFHAYFAGESGGMSVVVPYADHRLYVDPSSGTGYVTLGLQRDRTSLRGLALTPWTTLVVREEGYETLPGSISLQPDMTGRIRIVNRTTARLRDVIVIAPGGGEAWAFPEIPAGATRLATGGSVVPLTTLGSFITGSFVDTNVATPGVADNPTMHPGYQLAAIFGGHPDDVKNWDAALGAVPGLGTNGTAQPLLVAQVELPATSTSDGGLRIDRDVTFLRVVGWGGAP